MLLPLFVGVRGALLRGNRGSEEGDGAEPGRSGAVDEEASEEEPPPVDIDGRRWDISLWRQGGRTAWQGAKDERPLALLVPKKTMDPSLRGYLLNFV